MHKHHIIPRHMGGSDDPTNLIEVSVEEHAELHLSLYLEHGKTEDWVASQCLSGQMKHYDATIQIIKESARETCRKRNAENNPMWNPDAVAKSRAGCKKWWDENPDKKLEVAERMRKTNKGRKRSPETKAKMAEAARKRWADKKARAEQAEAVKKSWEKRKS